MLPPNSRSLFRVSLFVLFFLSLCFVNTAGAQQQQARQDDSRQQEVFLSFNYQNLFEKVVVAYYEDGNYYLPVSQIFSNLKIPHRVDNQNLVIEGTYLDPDNRFRFDFRRYRVTLDSEGTFQYDASEMMVKELDYYVRMNVLGEVFDLNFSVDLNNLLLQLQTPNVMPVVEEYERARRRQKQERATIARDYHPLEFGRDREVFGGGFFDYSLSSIFTGEENSYTYNLSLGSEILGGDLEGSAFGSYTNNFSSFTTNNLRWRYVMRDNEYLTQLYAGQTRSDGLINRNFTGLRLTNEPIEPRFMYDSYEIEGTAPIGSEVELYYNNNLYDFTRITDNRQYRFLAPLTYGTSRLRLRIYGPDGRIREREERIQIPFSFLPKNEVTYHLNAGKLDNTFLGTTRETYIAQGDVAYGISNWLTQKVGVEYFNEFTDQTPLLYSSTSARLSDEYLLNMDLAPNAFYRLSGNVIYPSSASWGLNYTYYDDSRIYNPVGNEQEFSANAFVPFTIAEQPFNIRFFGDYGRNPARDNVSYNVDLNSRVDRFNVRLSYRDRQFGDFSLAPSDNSELSASATYLISRTPNIPRYLQNTFVSGRIDYNTGNGTFREAEIQASRSIFEKGRLQASFARNFAAGFNYFNLGLTIDFSGFRSTSTARNVRNRSSFTQNIRGSIGYDDYNRDFVFSNREQVGRSATSLRLYVDANNSGTYEEGEDVIRDEAVRISRAGVMSSSGEGILRFSQLQAYHRINMEINQSAIKNPLLVPELEQFSIVTDPNQYKPINIPFYTSGVISGKVFRLRDGERSPLSGLRVYLDAKDGSFSREMQTFNDGAFYAYEVPPGSYNLYVDDKQLQFLDAVSQPDTMDVQVEALAEGDFVEGLNFTVIPRQDSTEKRKPIIGERKESPSDSAMTDRNPTYYKVQLASFRTLPKSRAVALNAGNRLGDTFSEIRNTNTELYAIRSGPIADRKEAIDKIVDYHGKNYENAALVILDRRITKAVSEPATVSIRLGQFETMEAADNFVQRITPKLGSELGVNYDSEIQRYTVYLNEQIESNDDLDRQLEALRADSALQNVAVEKQETNPLFLGQERKRAMDFTFQLQLTGDITMDDRSLKKVIESYTDLTLRKLDGVENGLIVGDMVSWSKVTALQEQLSALPDVNRVIAILTEK